MNTKICQPWSWQRGEENKQGKKVNATVEIPHYTYIFSDEGNKGDHKLKIERTVTKTRVNLD